MNPHGGRLAAALRRRAALAREDRGSLPMVMLIIIVGLALAAGVLPTLIVQDRATVFDSTRIDNLGAAQAGVDVVLGQIRSATTTKNGALSGDAAKLPCESSAAPITGTVSAAGTAAYSAFVSYYLTDPVTDPGATPMLCIAGQGTYDSKSAAFVPGYALITSTGTDGTRAADGTGGSSGRTIQTTYVFQVTNKNVPDGQIRIYPPPGATSASMCMDVGAAPKSGSPVVLATCSTSIPPLSQQLFSYRTDLTLQLDTTISVAYPNGLCLDTSVTGGAPAQSGDVYLFPCGPLGNPPYEQQWSFNDSGAFQASLSTTAKGKPDGTGAGDLSPYCMAVATQNAGQKVSLENCDGNVASTAQAWVPSPSVGDGAAAAPQLVNFQQFGRCLDITGQNVGAPQEIAYPCKQNPDRDAVRWNQKFSFDPVSGWLSTTTDDGTRYCLYSPRIEGGYVRLDKCTDLGWLPGVSAGQLVWRQPGDPSKPQSTPYPQRYTFVDSSTDAQRCLGISAPPTGDSSQWYYITVTTCNGSTAQKWNADPNLGSPSLQNVIEK